MKYIVALSCDADRQPVGLFAVNTVNGPVSFVFANRVRWDRFFRAASAALARHGEHLASTEIEARSINDAAEAASRMGRATGDPAVVLPDTAPAFEDVMAFLERQA